MSSELVDSNGSSDAACGDARASVVARVRAMFLRFPSASKGLLSICDQALVSGASFVTAAIVGRLTSPDELGLYYLVLSIVLIVSSVQEHMIGGPYMVLSKRYHGRALAEYGGSYWLNHLVLTVLITAGLAMAIVVCTAVGSTTILPGLWALLGAGPLLMLRDGIRRYTFGNLHVTSAVALDATVTAAQLGGLLLLAYTGRLSLLNIYGVMGAACALACLGWYLLDPPLVRFNRKRFLRDWRHNWSFGKWSLWSYVVTGTTTQMMIWILGLGIEASAAAMFGACTTLVGITNVLINGVGNVLTPLAAREFADGGANELRRILFRTSAFLTVVLGGFCLFVLATGDWLVVLVFGPYYHGTGAILFTLALCVLMNSQVMVAGNGLWAIGQPRSAFVADVFGMLVTLIAVFTLIKPFGVLGAAIANLSGTTVAAFARSIILARYFADDAAESNLSANPVLCPEGVCP